MGNSPLGTHWCRHMLYMRQAEHGETGATQRYTNYTHAGRGGGACAPPPPWSDRRQPGPALLQSRAPQLPHNLDLVTQHPGCRHMCTHSMKHPINGNAGVPEPRRVCKSRPSLSCRLPPMSRHKAPPHPYYSNTQGSDLPARKRGAPNAAQALARSRPCTWGGPGCCLARHPQSFKQLISGTHMASMHSSSRPHPCQRTGAWHACMRAMSAYTCCAAESGTQCSSHAGSPSCPGPSLPAQPNEKIHRSTALSQNCSKQRQISGPKEAELKYFRLCIADTGTQSARTCSSICSPTAAKPSVGAGGMPCYRAW